MAEPDFTELVLIVIVKNEAYLRHGLVVHLLVACSAGPYFLEAPYRLSEDSWPLVGPQPYKGRLAHHLAEVDLLFPGQDDSGHSRHLDIGCFHTLARSLFLLLHPRHSRHLGTHYTAAVAAEALRSLSPWGPVPLNQHTAAVGPRCILRHMPLLLLYFSVSS